MYDYCTCGMHAYAINNRTRLELSMNILAGSDRRHRFYELCGPSSNLIIHALCVFQTLVR